MKKYSPHFATLMLLVAGMAFCKKETTIPEYKIAEDLRNAQSALLQNKSDYYPKNCPAKNAIFIRGLPGRVAQLHPSFHLKNSSHDNA